MDRVLMRIWMLRMTWINGCKSKWLIANKLLLSLSFLLFSSLFFLLSSMSVANAFQVFIFDAGELVVIQDDWRTFGSRPYHFCDIEGVRFYIFVHMYVAK